MTPRSGAPDRAPPAGTPPTDTLPQRWVLDASVALKWVLPEPLAVEAGLLLAALESGAAQFHVPELWLAEVANALWVRTRSAAPERLTPAEAASIASEFAGLGLRRHSHGDLIPLAVALACDSGITVYDALYLALAIHEGVRLVTADDLLVRKAGLGDHVVALKRVADALG